MRTGPQACVPGNESGADLVGPIFCESGANLAYQVIVLKDSRTFGLADIWPSGHLA